MKRIWFFLLSFMLCSCGEFIDKPANLIPKDVMAEMLADIAQNDQVVLINPQHANPEAGTRFILQQYKVTARQFRESYKYYAMKGDMEGILEDAQDVLLERFPDSEPSVTKKLKSGQQKLEPVK